MRTFAWSVGLGLLGATIAVASGCTVTVNNDDAGFPDFDTGAFPEPEASTPGPEAGTGVETGTPDSGTTTTPDGTVEAGCGTEVMTGASAACDTCLNTSCCTQLDTCATPDAMGVDDAGASACLQYAQCVLDWVNAGAGDMASGRTTCAASHTSTQQSQGNMLLDCIQSTCAAPCM